VILRSYGLARPGALDGKNLLGVEPQAGLGQIIGRAAEAEGCGQLELADERAPLLEVMKASATATISPGDRLFGN
jgi:hypothetical protein